MGAKGKDAKQPVGVANSLTATTTVPGYQATSTRAESGRCTCTCTTMACRASQAAALGRTLEHQQHTFHIQFGKLPQGSGQLAWPRPSGEDLQPSKRGAAAGEPSLQHNPQTSVGLDSNPAGLTHHVSFSHQCGKTPSPHKSKQTVVLPARRHAQLTKPTARLLLAAHTIAYCCSWLLKPTTNGPPSAACCHV